MGNQWATIREYLAEVGRQGSIPTDGKDAQPGRPYQNIEAFVLQHGAEMYPDGFPPHLPRGEMGDCYRNASHLVSEYGRQFTYCEGYARRFGNTDRPLLHAWVLDGDGMVVDPTWHGDDIEYFGVRFRNNYWWVRMMRSRKFTLLDAPDEDYPLLTGEHSIKEAVLLKGEKDEPSNVYPSFRPSIRCHSYAGQDLGGAEWVRYTFTNCDFRNANLSGASLRGACLWECDLRGANLAGANLTGCRYDESTHWPEGFDPQAWGATLDE